MNEIAALFGPERNLMGILTSPSQSNGQPLACLMLNVGVTHRVGPRRLNVKLARRLSAHGITSLRFDLSGIGDSPSANSRAAFREQAIRDMQAAMDHVETSTGIRHFVVLGICSGATNGYWLARADPRVVGLLMFDGFTFPTFKTQVLHDWLRLRTTPWKTVVQKIMLRVKRIFGATSTSTAASIFNAVSDQSKPSAREFAEAMDALTARGVSTYLIYSGSLLLHHNYHAQLRDAMGNAPFLNRVRYDYMPDVDHIATSLAAQDKLLAVLCQWVCGLSAGAVTPTVDDPIRPQANHRVSTVRG